jgi:hypothetical protein
MSTFVYARLTTRREEATPGSSRRAESPGLGSYVDAMAALVPTEVLTMHAVILPLTTKTKTDAAGQATTTIIEPDVLAWTFVGLVILNVVIYLLGRGKTLDRYDWVRAAIPPIAFVAWTMLQRSTAFDAISPGLPDAQRTVIAIFIATILSLIATVLAGVADQKDLDAATPPSTRE